MKIEELSLEVEGLLGRLVEERESPEEKELLLAAIDAIRFISSKGQLYDLEDYRKGLASDAPPRVVAAFNTREDADAWLKGHPKPPHLAYVLVAGEYHVVLYLRETGHRELLPHPALEYYIRDMVAEGMPPVVATFHTREEAEAWLANQGEPPDHAFILVAGERHLALCHQNVDYRGIHPISIAQRLDQKA